MEKLVGELFFPTNQQLVVGKKIKFSPDLEKLAANMAHDRKQASKQEIQKVNMKHSMAQTYLQTHYSNGFFGNVYLPARVESQYKNF